MFKARMRSHSHRLRLDSPSPCRSTLRLTSDRNRPRKASTRNTIVPAPGISRRIGVVIVRFLSISSPVQCESAIQMVDLHHERIGGRIRNSNQCLRSCDWGNHGEMPVLMMGERSDERFARNVAEFPKSNADPFEPESIRSLSKIFEGVSLRTPLRSFASERSRTCFGIVLS